MGYLTKWGGLWGVVPPSQGRIFFIAPAASYTVDGRAHDASNENDGLSPERAIRDINRFNTLATANAGDVAIMLAGTNTVTAVQRITKAGLTILGVHSQGQLGPGRTVRQKAALASTGTSTVTLSIEADDTEIGFLTFIPTSTFSAIQFRNAAPDRVYIHDCFFDLATPAVSTGTYGIDFAYRADSSTATGASNAKLLSVVNLATAYIERCTFWSDGAQGRAVDIASASVVVRDCWFHNSAGAWTTPFAVATSADSCLVESSVWTTAGTMGSCIDGTTADVADGVSIRYCTFPRTGVITSGVVIDNFGANEAQLVECYQEGSGTALSAIT